MNAEEAGKSGRVPIIVDGPRQVWVNVDEIDRATSLATVAVNFHELVELDAKNMVGNNSTLVPGTPTTIEARDRLGMFVEPIQGATPISLVEVQQEPVVRVEPLLTNLARAMHVMVELDAEGCLLSPDPDAAEELARLGVVGVFGDSRNNPWEGR